MRDRALARHRGTVDVSAITQLQSSRRFPIFTGQLNDGSQVSAEYNGFGPDLQ
jgi:hypothetical protein